MKTILLTIILATITSQATATERLTDNRGRVIGYEKTLSTGKKQMLDKHGRSTGYYNPKTRQTTDARGRVIGSGNQLSTTIKAPPSK